MAAFLASALMAASWICPAKAILCPLNVSTAHLNSVFNAIETVHEHRPVYRDAEGKLMYFIMVNGQIGRWMIGDRVGSSSGWAFVDSYAANPLLIADVSPRARFWDNHSGRFAPLEGPVSIKCVSKSDNMDQPSTDGTIFLHILSRPRLAGFYTATGRISQDEKPIYILTRQGFEKPLFLFSVEGYRWIIGEKPDIFEGLAYVDSKAKTPMEISTDATWMIGRGDSWQKEKYAKLIVSGEDGGIFKEMLRVRRTARLRETPIFNLSNNVAIPRYGFGTGALHPNDQLPIVRRAMDVGYKLLDSATAYNNEGIIGAVLRERLNRQEMFITTKVWPTELGYRHTLESFEESLQKLGTVYVDLYMIHWPFCYSDITWMECHRAKGGTWQETYKAMERLYAEGRILSLGVSNFDVRLLEETKSYAVGPHVVQNFLDILHADKDTRAFCAENNIFYQAYSLVRSVTSQEGEYPALYKLLESISKTYHRSPQSILLNFFSKVVSTSPNSEKEIPLGILTRSSRLEHIKQNLNAGEWILSQNAMDLLEQIWKSGSLKNVVKQPLKIVKDSL